LSNATFATVSQVRVVCSLPKVFSMSDMKTGLFGSGEYALKASQPSSGSSDSRPEEMRRSASAED
jgi:hypothetical protein